VTFEPGASSVTPGPAELAFQFRDVDITVLECVGAATDFQVGLEAAAELHAPSRQTRVCPAQPATTPDPGARHAGRHVVRAVDQWH